MISGTIWVNDRHEIIRDAEDLAQLLRELLGDDVARMVQTLADSAESYERALELILDALQDTLHTIHLIRAELTKSRASKSNVLKLLDNIERAINEHV